MRLMRSLYIAVFCLCALATVVSAQLTGPVPTSFKMLEFNCKNTLGDLMTTGTLEYAVTDTLPQVHMSVTCVDTVLYQDDLDSMAIIIDVSYVLNNGMKVAYRDTHRLHEQGFFPDRPQDATVTGDMLPDSVFSVVYKDTQVPNTAAYERFEFTIREVTGDLPVQSRLTLIATDADTVLSANDTAWSDAMPWDDNIALHWKGTASSDDDLIGVLTYQLKLNYDSWSGGATPNDRVFVIDTIRSLTTQTKTIRVLDKDARHGPLSIAPADSIRFQIMGCTGTTKWYINYLKAMWEE